MGAICFTRWPEDLMDCFIASSNTDEWLSRELSIRKQFNWIIIYTTVARAGERKGAFLQLTHTAQQI